MQVLWYVAAALPLLAITVCIGFVRWRARARRRLLTASTLVNTQRGQVDCAFAGPDDAPAVLLLHGGLGGWDQASALAADCGLDRMFRVIAPSRPGYLRTPLESGEGAQEAADAMAALLDSLGIQSAHVVGISGGGPTALAMAARHPQRVRTLVMVCAISHRHVQPGITTDTFMGRLLFSNVGGWFLDFGCWLILQTARLAPAFMTRRILSMTDLRDRQTIRACVLALRKSPERMRWVLRLLEHSFPISPRKAGLNNDLAVFASLSDRIDGPITVPVLVVHGRVDGNVPVAHALAVIAAVPRAESLLIDDASHLLWLHPRIDEIRDRVRRFLDATPARANEMGADQQPYR